MEDEIVLTGLNLTFDFVKHITTLDTGLIVILATLLEKVFTKPKWKLLIILCIISLSLSLIGSLIFLSELSRWMMYRSVYIWPESMISGGLWMSIYGFYSALGFFIVFTLKNFLSGEGKK